MNIINEVRQYNKFCEVFGRTIDTSISVINSGYSGEVICNACQKHYRDMWKFIQDDKDKLVREIAFIRKMIKDKDGEVEKQLIINKKLRERKAIQRAAAQYISMYGHYENDKEVLKRLNSLCDNVYSIQWSFETPIVFMKQHDSIDTIFFIRPSIQDDVLSDTFIECINNLKGSWVMCDFLDSTVLEVYSNFDIKYDYDYNRIPKLNTFIMKGV